MQAEAFKAAHVYPHMGARDENELVNAQWLLTLTEANHGFSTWEDAPPIRGLSWRHSASAKSQAGLESKVRTVGGVGRSREKGRQRLNKFQLHCLCQITGRPGEQGEGLRTVCAWGGVAQGRAKARQHLHICV